MQSMLSHGHIGTRQSCLALSLYLLNGRILRRVGLSTLLQPQMVGSEWRHRLRVLQIQVAAASYQTPSYEIHD